MQKVNSANRIKAKEKDAEALLFPIFKINNYFLNH